LLPSLGQVFRSVEDFKRQMSLYGWIEKGIRRFGRVALLSFYNEDQNVSIFLRKDLSHGILVAKIIVISRALEFVRRDAFEVVLDCPDVESSVRYWDLAATLAEKGSDPDYTVGCLMSRLGDIFYIRDIQRLRDVPSVVESLVYNTAKSDGKETIICMEQEPGSGGVNTIDSYRRRIIPVGFSFYADKSVVGKETRNSPFLAHCQQGKVKLIQGSWINDFLSEIEVFPEGFHDDQVDAASGAFRVLLRS
jgi:predicted phage terminase large subunit-like protein